MSDYFVHRPALAVVIAAVLIGFGAAFVTGSLAHRSSPSDPGGLLCTEEHWSPVVHDWTCLTWTHVRGTVEFPTRPDPAGCPLIALDRTAWRWRCATPA
ncbi:MAG TPA: hypothetical protein VJQ85_02520 [Gaiellaceae bacterium]|nr:hypothetical protein [Gaiellaceae bacterium]